MHLGAAEGLLVDELVDRHLHERWSPEVGGATALDEHGVVAHARRVGAAGGGRAEADGDGWDAEFRELGLVAEALAAADEDVGLMRQIGSG